MAHSPTGPAVSFKLLTNLALQSRSAGLSQGSLRVVFGYFWQFARVEKRMLLVDVDHPYGLQFYPTLHPLNPPLHSSRAAAGNDGDAAMVAWMRRKRRRKEPEALRVAGSLPFSRPSSAPPPPRPSALSLCTMQ